MPTFFENFGQREVFVLIPTNIGWPRKNRFSKTFLGNLSHFGCPTHNPGRFSEPNRFAERPYTEIFFEKLENSQNYLQL